MIGLSIIGNSSLGMAVVAGRKRVPRPATENTAFVTFRMMEFLENKMGCYRLPPKPRLLQACPII